jgi:hypothetical protein
MLSIPGTAWLIFDVLAGAHFFGTMLDDLDAAFHAFV